MAPPVPTKPSRATSNGREAMEGSVCSESARMPAKGRIASKLPSSMYWLHVSIFDVSSELSELGLDLALAKIVTEKGAAIDSFYVTEFKPGENVPSKVEDPERQKQIIARLKRAAGDP